jgi:translocon-associated protein subunit alpha
VNEQAKAGAEDTQGSAEVKNSRSREKNHNHSKITFSFSTLKTEDEPVGSSLSSPFVRTNILFIKPESSDLPAGKLARVLISFQNNGSDAFLVEGIDGSLRFPQDFSYYIQNVRSFI